MTKPILVYCEGSGCPAARCMDSTTTNPAGICSMCGMWAETTGGIMRGHSRVDVLAMIDRGDFDEPGRTGDETDG